MTIKAKIILAFTLVLLGTCGLGGFAINRLQDVNAASADVRDNRLPATRALGDLGRAAERFRAGQGTWLLAVNQEGRDRATAAQQKALQLYQQAWSLYEPLITPADEPALAAAVTDAWAEYTRATQKLVTMASAGDKDAVAAFYTDNMFALMGAFRKALDADVDFQHNASDKAGNHSDAIATAARTWILITIAATTVLGFGVGWSLIRGISVPITTMTTAMRRLARQEKATEVPGVGRRDEIGSMATAVQVFKDNMIRADQLAVEQEKAKAAAAATQKAAMGRTADAFETEVGGLVSVLSAAATELQATAQAMSATALRTNGQAAKVAGATEQASAGIQTAAAAAEELTASISEISRQVSQSSKITRQAVADAQRTNVIVQTLSEGGEKIGHVIALITNIASQTNLLALNATIEAARAGDAGKGFAVVANEVKSLANQTAKATEEIGIQIAQIQSATQQAVEAIQAITATIEEVSAIAVTIAASVEQQGAATSEIARNVQQTAANTQDVTTNIGGVSQAAAETGSAANQVLDAAGNLAQQAGQLTTAVQTFVAGVRAA